jgi:hypothetical protein
LCTFLVLLSVVVMSDGKSDEPRLLGAYLGYPTLYSQRSASEPAVMHRALLVEEILARVVDESDIYANLVLARTCHSFTELALDAMWADRGTVELWGLAQYMSDELSVQESRARVDSWPTTVHVLVSRPLRLRCGRS